MKHTNFAKKSLSAVLVLAMLLGILAMLPITVGAATPSGAGTKENPIQVSTAAQLKALPTTLATAQKTNGVSYVEITADITIGDYNMATIDIDEYPVFIEGNNHKISNFTITSGSTYAGLFHKFAMNSTVQNLHIVNGKVSCASGNDGIDHILDVFFRQETLEVKKRNAVMTAQHIDSGDLVFNDLVRPGFYVGTVLADEGIDQ